MADVPTESLVEIKPEVVFLYEILQELTRQQIRIPRFQRAFVWRPDQMTDLLDSINKQYPIGSLLVWETDEDIATLDRLGPFDAVGGTRGPVGYLLDGHQRLMTLAGALLTGTDSLVRREGVDNGQWEMYWNVHKRKFQHKTPADADDVLFPMTSLLDTLKFFESVETLRTATGSEGRAAVSEISALARTFQSYRIPVIRMKQTGLSEAVEIFTRLNSKGQSMTADQMVSALTFRQQSREITFDLATEIDRMVETLGERRFGDIDRNTLLRAILANLDENIYKTDWTRLTQDRRDTLQDRLREAVDRTNESLERALAFLAELGVTTSRLLPYGLQLIVLSAFFDRRPNPSSAQRAVLARWFWVSSFSAWFGGANPSRIAALIKEFRDGLAVNDAATGLSTFDLEAEALPYPLNFDMRSARARTLLLVMLSAHPEEDGEDFTEFAVDQLSVKGPSAVGNVFWSPPSQVRGNPANRVFRPPSFLRGALADWILDRADRDDWPALTACGIVPEAVEAVRRDDPVRFIQLRQAELIALELGFQQAQGVTPSRFAPQVAPVDTDE